MPRVMAMLTKAELARLPREVQKAIEVVRSEKPGLPDEALLGEALSRDPRLIRVFREWEREGRPSPAERELRDQLGVLDKLRADAILLGAQLGELRRRAERLYPPPRRDPPPLKRVETSSRPSPVRKADDEDWRARTLEAVIADLYAVADAMPSNLARRLVRVINELNAVAEELGGEGSQRRLKAMCAA